MCARTESGASTSRTCISRTARCRVRFRCWPGRQLSADQSGGPDERTGPSDTRAHDRFKCRTIGILVSGNLRELMHDIERMRAEAKARKGWVMDTYLLRKHDA